MGHACSTLITDITKKNGGNGKRRGNGTAFRFSLFFQKLPLVVDNILLSEIRSISALKEGESLKETNGDGENANEGFGEKKRAQIRKLLSDFGHWKFDLLEFSKLTNQHPLLYICYFLFHKLGFVKKFNVEEKVLVAFLSEIEEKHWNGNQFFNSTMACDALLCFHYMIDKTRAKELLGIDEICAGLLSCCCMYLDFPPLDNHYQIQKRSYVATQYNDLSPLQNNSISQFYKIIDRVGHPFSHAEEGTIKNIREILVGCVLCVDPIHFRGEVLKPTMQCVKEGADYSKKEDLRILLQLMIVFSSLCFYTRDSSKYKFFHNQLWVYYTLQGDIEKKEGFKAHHLGRRTIKEHLRYVDAHVAGIVKLISRVLPKLKFANHNLKKNKEMLYKLNLLSKRKEKIERGEEILEEKEELDLFKKDLRELEKYTKMDFDDPEYPTTHQKEFEAAARARPRFPEDRKVNVPWEEQEKRFLHPTERQLINQQNCMIELKERWDIEKGETREILKEEPLIYALSDFENHPLDILSDEEIRYSVLCMFERIDEWNFDPFCLTALLGNDSLILTAYVLFVKYDFFRRFQIDEQVFFNFVGRVQRGYHRNDYHNVMHGQDVMQICNSLIKKGGMIEKMAEADVFGALLSGMVHDLDHPGFNDAFQVNSYSYLAQLYNDRSVLESHHVAETFRIMKDEEQCDVMANMTDEEYRSARKTMVEMTVSTDMANHAKYVKEFNELVENGSKFTSSREIRCALQIVIKMADISNPSRPLYLYLQWTDKLLREFYRQGDAEKKFGLPVSPLMDRETSVISRGQKAFMEYVLIPMFSSFASVFPRAQYAADRIRPNKQYWEEHEEIEKEFLAPKAEKKSIEEISTICVKENKFVKQILYEKEKYFAAKKRKRNRRKKEKEMEKEKQEMEEEEEEEETVKKTEIEYKSQVV